MRTCELKFAFPPHRTKRALRLRIGSLPCTQMDHHAGMPTHPESKITASIKPADQLTTNPTSSFSRHFPDGVDWGVVAWITVVHLGALAAPWTFSWQGLVAMFVMYWLTGGIGICLGYHRLLSHRSFQTFLPLKWFIAWIGGLAGEGSAIHWSANHRIHHAKSDHNGDPIRRAKAFCGAMRYGVCNARIPSVVAHCTSAGH